MKNVHVAAMGLSFVLAVAFASSCSQLTPAPAATGGSSGQGGTTSNASSTATSGMTATGGTMSAGSTTSTAGVTSAGASPSGGLTSAGGTTTAGGTPDTGGTTGTAGVTSAGASPSGGLTSAGGTTTAGGTPGTGGTTSTAGVTSTGATVSGGLALAGGTTTAGGTPGTGTTTTAGASGTSGTTAAGGSMATGGAVSDAAAVLPDGGGDVPATGGVLTEGGVSATGGTSQTGGTTSSGGTTGTDGATLNLVFSDEFNGPANMGADTTKWVYSTWNPGTVNNDQQKYTDRIDNVFQDGQGHMVLRALNDNYDGYPYTSGRLETNGMTNFQYGRFEIRAMLPAGLGSFPGFVLMGTTGSWPQCGEISIMEQWGQDKSSFNAGTQAGGASGDIGYVTYNFPTATTASSDFHVYSVDWYADHIVFQVDGTEFASTSYNTTSPFYSIPEYLILSLALGGTQGGAIDSTAFPMDLVIDYVRVYSF